MSTSKFGPYKYEEPVQLKVTKANLQAPDMLRYVDVIHSSVATLGLTAYDDELRQEVPTVRRCPAFNLNLSLGWIVPAVERIQLEIVRSCDKIVCKSSHDSPGHPHTSVQANFREMFGAAYAASFKIATPYSVSCPEGWVLLLNDVFWGGGKQFRAVEGVLDTQVEPRITVNLVLLGEVGDVIVIDPGTPLVRIVPVPRESLAAELVS